MKKIILSFFLISVLLPLTSFSADAFNFRGFYLGGTVGGAVNGDSDWKYTGGSVPTPNPVSTTGLVGGAFISYQYQFTNNIVLGLEAKALGSDAKGNSTCPNTAWNCKVELSSLFFIGPRLGYAYQNFQAYGTVGYAEARVKSIATTPGVQAEVDKNNNNGFGVGFGLDYAKNQNWIVGLQYLHTELNHEFFRVYNGADRNVDNNSDYLFANLSYKF